MHEVFAKLHAFFTAEEQKVAAEVGEIHALLLNLANRVEALEQKAVAEVKAHV